MKKSLILVGMLVVGYANAQEGNVGINTENPKATLDINAYKTDGSTKEGLLIPRLSKEAISKMANPEISTLVYVTDDVLASDSAKFQGTGKGFYFYNGTKWVKQLDTDNDSIKNIYNADGTLTADRKVTMNGKNLTFSGTAPLTIGKNGFIGFNTNNPTSALTLKGNGGGSDDIVIHSYSANQPHHAFALYTTRYRGTEEEPEVVQVGDYLGAISFRAYNGTSVVNGTAIDVRVSEVDDTGVKSNLIIQPTKNVGIGTIDPKARLDIYHYGSNIDIPVLRLGTRSNVNNSISKGIEFFSDNANFPASIDVVREATSTRTGLSFSTSNAESDVRSEKMRIEPNGNVGINTTAPTERLDVDGNIRSSNLRGTGTRNVVADENGVLRTGDATNIKLATTNNVECIAENTGTMNFGVVSINGKDTEAFGFCMKNSAGEYKWFYIYGGAGVTNGSGAFGSGL